MSDIEQAVAGALHANELGCTGVCSEAERYPDLSDEMLESGRAISRKLHAVDAPALLAALAERGYEVVPKGGLDELREALEQALDRMETAWRHLGAEATDEDKEAVAIALWFGQEELRALLDEAPQR